MNGSYMQHSCLLAYSDTVRIRCLTSIFQLMQHLEKKRDLQRFLLHVCSNISNNDETSFIVQYEVQNLG